VHLQRHRDGPLLLAAYLTNRCGLEAAVTEHSIDKETYHSSEDGKEKDFEAKIHGRPPLRP
jgi:hypothetical protein